MTTSAPTPTSTPRRPRHWIVWPGGLIFLVSALVVVDVTMMVVASSDPTFAVAQVDGDPSEAWNARRAADRASDRLGWTAELAVDCPVDGPPVTRLVVQDADGAPVPGLTVALTAFHHARAADRRKTVLSAVTGTPGAYAGSVPMTRDGRYHFELTCTRGDERFITRVDRLVILAAAPVAPGGPPPEAAS